MASSNKYLAFSDLCGILETPVVNIHLHKQYNHCDYNLIKLFLYATYNSFICFLIIMFLVVLTKPDSFCNKRMIVSLVSHDQDSMKGKQSRQNIYSTFELSTIVLFVFFLLMSKCNNASIALPRPVFFFAIVRYVPHKCDCIAFPMTFTFSLV